VQVEPRRKLVYGALAESSSGLVPETPPSGAAKVDVGAAIEAHVLTTAELVGTYER
jgi:hypothetical protein